jgi:hypothetical protein
VRSGVPVPWYHSRAAAGGGAATPGGSDTQVQFNDGGALGGDAGLVYNKTSDALTVGGVTATGSPGFIVESAGDSKVKVGTSFNLSSDVHLKWYDNADIDSGAADAGLKRNAAGVIEATDGSAGAGSLKAGNLKLTTNTLSAENANGNVVLSPNGTGIVSLSGFTAGFYAAANNELFLVSNGVAVLEMYQATTPMIRNDGQYTISATSGVGGADVPDVGIKRLAAGKLQGTDGSSGSLTAFQLTATVGLFQGTGSPESVVTAGIGSLYLRTDGGTGTAAYVKETGAGNTGWKALVGV